MNGDRELAKPVAMETQNEPIKVKSLLDSNPAQVEWKLGHNITKKGIITIAKICHFTSS